MRRRIFPAGLTLDAKTGIITGTLAGRPHARCRSPISNPKGKATGKLTIVGGDDALALTPPLGWNSWNAWGNTVTAEKVLASAEGMVKSGLNRQGYTYVNIDDVWEGGNEPNPGTGRGRNVAGARDANGEPTTNANFPDMKGLVDHIHALGLKAGLYSSPGPTTCQGLGATWQHEEQDARAYARWGFDYLKYDWCGYSQIAPTPTLEDRKKPYKLMGDILKKQDRDIVFSLCQYGAGSVWEWGNDVGGHLWRMTGDIRDDWPSMTGIGFQQTGREQFAGPGGWNDTDMLVVGMRRMERGIAADESHAERAAHAHRAVGAAGGADADRRGPLADRRLDDEHPRQPRNAGRQSGRARQGRWPQDERRLD